MNTIQSSWESYRREVVPANAGEIQIEECRRAFYAGFAGCLGVCSGPLAEMEEDAAVAALQGLHEEIQGFAQGIGDDN
jgi:hypothetical protein